MRCINRPGYEHCTPPLNRTIWRALKLTVSGLRQVDVARKMHVNQATVSRLLRKGVTQFPQLQHVLRHGRHRNYRMEASMLGEYSKARQLKTVAPIATDTCSLQGPISKNLYEERLRIERAGVDVDGIRPVAVPAVRVREGYHRRHGRQD